MKGRFWVCDREFVGFVYKGILWVSEKYLDLRIDLKNLGGGDVGLIMQCLCLNQVTKMKCLQHVTTLQQPRGTVCMCFCDWLTRNDKKMLENLGVCCYI